MRASEALGLQWSDVDMEGGSLMVRQGLAADWLCLTTGRPMAAGFSRERGLVFGVADPGRGPGGPLRGIAEALLGWQGRVWSG